jgi:hypothetical protein
MLLYRFFAIHFPIVAGEGKAAAVRAEAPHRHVPVLKPVWTAVFRGTAAAFLIGFVVLYSLVHTRAIEASAEASQIIQLAKAVPRPALDTAAFTHSARPDAYRNLYVLDSPELNRKTDYYEPVRFTHLTHEVNSDSNCATATTATPWDPRPDRRGPQRDARGHRGPHPGSSACPATRTDRGRVSQVLAVPFRIERAGLSGPIGLKGLTAVHGARESPTRPRLLDCGSCHHPLVPDHKSLCRRPAFVWT